MKNIARLSGLMYLVIIISGLFSEVFIKENIINWGDALVTLDNINNSGNAIRQAFTSDALMVIADIFLAILFYYLLKNTSVKLALTAMIFRLVQAAMIGFSILFIFSVDLTTNILTEQSFTSKQIAELNLLFLKMHNIGYLLSGVFFGISCLFTGYLFRKSIILPSVLGYFLITGGLAYLFVALANFLMPDLTELADSIVMVTAVFSELSVCLYLLIKGTKN